MLTSSATFYRCTFFFSIKAYKKRYLDIFAIYIFAIVVRYKQLALNLDLEYVKFCEDIFLNKKGFQTRT